MSNEQAPGDKRPLLRTLSPALRGLEKSLRGWLEGPHRYALGTITRASLEGAANDLRRKLGTGDQRKLDEYLDAVRGVERRLGYSRPAGDGWRPPTKPEKLTPPPAMARPARSHG